MSSLIRVLDEQTINQMAAGEVIENPASVVKELVENAIDAQASEITVEIRGGGRQLIRISDNGCGMNADDALLCFERHATSKIKAVEDIYCISTMGFRGEALPSIASISKLTLTTMPKDKQEATLVRVEGGKILQCANIASTSYGTTIEVQSLFFNVPVRKKFQKSPVYDANEIQRVLSVLALGYPQIQFKLINNQELIFQTHASSNQSWVEQIRARIEQVLGKNYAQELTPIEGQEEEFHIQGFIGLPAAHRSNRTGQYLFINQRAVQSPAVSYAIKDGYGTVLPPQRHPIFIVYIKLPGTSLDVNVHPQKKEVRIRQEDILRRLIIRSVEKTLYQPPQHQSAQSLLDTQPVFESFQHASFSAIPVTEPFSPSYTTWQQKIDLEPSLESSHYQVCESTEVYSPVAKPSSLQQPALFEIPKTVALPVVLTTLPGFIIAEYEQKLKVIHQRPAHTRVIFETLKNKDRQALGIERLLLPHPLDLQPWEAKLISQHLSLLQQFGLDITPTGPSHFMLHSVPHIFGRHDLQILIDEILKQLHHREKIDQLEIEWIKSLAQSASRAAISAHKKLSLSEAKDLVQRLMQCETSHLCPQGQPTYVILEAQDLVKFFKESK